MLGRFSRRLLNVLRAHLPMLIVGLYLALVPHATFAAPGVAPIDDIFVRSCTAGNTVATFIAQSFTAFLPVILGIGGVYALFQRERATAAITGIVHHVADAGMTGVYIVGAALVGGAITVAIAGRSCPTT